MSSGEFFELPPMSPEQAEETARLDKEVCEILLTKEVTDASQLREGLHDLVRFHMVTCDENHYRIEGLSL